MSVGTTASTLDIVNNVVQDFEIDMSEYRKYSSTVLPCDASSRKSCASEIQESIKNMTGTSCSYSSCRDASRSHLRLKMSGSPKQGLGLPGGRSSMTIPSLLQKLPCHGSSTKPSQVLSSISTSPASAVTLSALNVIEKGSDLNGMPGDYDIMKDKLGSSRTTDSDTGRNGINNFNADLVNLDSVDLDNIPMGDLQGLQAADGDTLRAKHLNKLSPKEREYVLQDIHGVADDMDETNNILFVDDSLMKFQEEIENELVLRRAEKNFGNYGVSEMKNGSNCNQQEQSTSTWKPEPDTPKLPALEERLGKLQEKLDELVRERNNLNNSVNGVSDFPSSKQLSAKNHPMFGKIGDIGGISSFPFGSNSGSYKNKSSMRPTAVPSSCFGGSSSFFSPTTALAKSSLATASGAQEDASILKNTNAIAYEQALAQCRGRRRERNNSLFRPNVADEDEDLDEGLYIDVEQREFRLSFLRAERFDTKKAAMRFIEYFEEKRRLFGVDNLTTKIKIKYLDTETKNCLESGQVQLLPGRDRAGRAVIVGTTKLAIARGKFLDQKSILRALWVLCSIALEDLKNETGVVFVNYAIGGNRDDSSSGFSHEIRDWGNILRALPLRVASIHWCVDNHKLKQTAYLSALMLGASNFVRVRCHAGSDMEVQYDLNTFGIPTDLLPVSMTGQVNLSRHNEFLRDRKKSEAYTLLNKALALVEAPMLDDCIALDGCDDELSASVSNENRIVNNSMVTTQTGHNSHNNTGNNFRQNQVQFKPEQYHKHREVNQTMPDFAYNPTNNTDMNKMAAAPFNDSFCMMGNRNQVQAQPCMQQFQQRRQQQQQHHLNGFQQQHLGMNMNMGMVQQFSQNQQMQRQQRRQQHQNGESKSGISYSMEPVLVPGELDILLGRGRGAQNHKGNIHYRQVVETFRSRYEQIPQKGAKTQLIREVVAVIYDNGGRFLKQDGFGRWIPVDPEVARDKVSHSFRNQKRLSVGASSPSSIESSLSKKRSREETK